LILLFLTPYNALALNQINTKYYTIVYDENGEYTAGEIAKFCDEIYEQLMVRYDSFTDDPRVICIVNDAIDMANGFAQYYQNTITIFATNMDFELRGQSNWLKNVFVHEMTHLIALKKASKGPINFVGLNIGKYNDNPDMSVSVALYHLSQPAWFSEGTAQVGAESYGSEQWDTHRDMLLRTAWYEESLLTIDEMSVLSGKNGMDAEMVYNQGYSLVKYIKEKYGYDKVMQLNNECGIFDFDPTIKKILGKTSLELYEEWRSELNKKYAPFRNKTFSKSDLAEDNGSTDYFPAVSPDGRYLAWLSNRGKDYAIMDLMLKDLTTGSSRVVVEEVDYSISWSHDSKKILYVKRPPRRKNFYDIYTYDVESRKEKRLSKQLRTRDPSFSPGDSLIVFVRNEGGNNAIAVINANGTGLRYLTSTHDGTQFYRPSFSPDCSSIVFGLYRQNLDRDIALIDAGVSSYRYKWEVADSTSAFTDTTSFAKESNFRLLLGSTHDERDPWFLPDGGGIVFASDRTGVFNIYKLDFETGRTTRLTDVYGGAFCPSAESGGEVYYAGYTPGNFSIYRTSLNKRVEEFKPIVEERDYLEQPLPFDLSSHFTKKPFGSKKILNAVVPVFNIGPTYIGSEFGLNVLDVGGEVYVSDLLGQDAFILSGSIGRNFKEDVPLNNRYEVYYQRKMVPVTSGAYTHSPTMYMHASRSVINNYIKWSDSVVDSVYFDGISNNIYYDIYDKHQEISDSDIYRYDFRYYTMGIHIPLMPRHSLRAEAGLRQYYETVTWHEEINDLSKYLFQGYDVSVVFPDAGKKSSMELRYFKDLEYFRSGEFSLGYNYYKLEPAADSDISPAGTAALLQFRHMKTQIADSLYSQMGDYVPFGLNYDYSFALLFRTDPVKDALRPYKKNLDVNEYMMFLQKNCKLPFLSHVFGGTAFVGYRDVSLKDVRKREGLGFNWPLKYYLGGAAMLSGYPYFSFWGTKVFYSRFDYVFPIKRTIGKNAGGLHFQRLYGAAFFEAGETWNFRKLNMDNIQEGSFKTDIGFELKLKMVGFYRLPIFLTAKIVWPLDDMGDSPYRNQRDARRFYFTLRM